MNTVVQARAVGNAVYLEHPGCCGDLAAWGMESKESAAEIATAINRAIAEAVTAAAQPQGKAP